MIRLVILLVAVEVFGNVRPLAADETVAKNIAVENDLVRKSTHPVWFDAKTGNITPVAARKNEIDVSDRHSSVATPEPRTNSAWWDSLSGSLSMVFSWLFEGWLTILGVFLVLLAIVAGFLLWRYGSSGDGFFRSREAEDLLAHEREKAKIQDLPFEIEQTAMGLLGQAAKLRAAGDYSKAIVYLFSHVLVEMDGARCIRLTRGKTNRIYLRELRGREMLKNFTNQLVQAFEFAFFGKHQLSQESFEAIWQQLPVFEESLKHFEPGTPTESFSTIPGSALR
ncbi:MAG: hypothetical protein NTU79_08190 [Planctomycetota bacterium]|nr:hypothetical protein [Planctomycetota bacterium]